MAEGEHSSHRKHRRSDDGEEMENSSRRRKHHSRSDRHHRRRGHHSKHTDDKVESDHADRCKLADYANGEMEDGEILEAEDDGVATFRETVEHSDIESGEIKPEEATEDASSLRDNSEPKLHTDNGKSSPYMKRLYVGQESIENVAGRPLAAEVLSPSQMGITSEDDCADKLDKTQRSKNLLRTSSILEPNKSFNHDGGICTNRSMHVVDKEAASASISVGHDKKFRSKSEEAKEDNVGSTKRSFTPDFSVDNHVKGGHLTCTDILVHVSDKTSYDHHRARASFDTIDTQDKDFMHETTYNDSKIKADKGQTIHSHSRKGEKNVVDNDKSPIYQELELNERNIDGDRENDPISGSTKVRSGSSVSSRQGEREEKHDPWEPVWEKDKDREWNQHGSKDRYRMGERDGDRERSRHDSSDRGREREKVRERSRNESHYIQSDRDTAKNMHDSRGRSRVAYHERGIDRENNRYGTHIEDRKRGLDREADKEQERERENERGRGKRVVKDIERDGDMMSKRYRRESPEGRHRKREQFSDSRHSKYADREHRRHGSREKELITYPHGVNLDQGKESGIRDNDVEEDFQERIALKLVAEEEEEEDIDRIKEESRKRRQAILEKYRQRQAQEDGADALPIFQESSDANEARHENVQVADQSLLLPAQTGETCMDRQPTQAGLGNGSPKSDKSEDMFCDDIFGESPSDIQKLREKSEDMFGDDIFGESPAGVRKPGRGDGLKIDNGGLRDNWDDSEGYYSYRIGEVLDGRYEITAGHGKGVFSTVVRAKDLKAGKGDPEEIAVKIIRNNETMYKAGLEEVNILNKIVGADPDDRRHCVRFISSFKYRNHLCLVFESLNMNLREVLKKFGRNIGLKLTAVRAYAKQLFIALKHLKNCGVLHCDIKPDNMLVNEAKNVLKLCDFGNAMFAGKNEITPYLVSRFYRAPEIILGLPYDHPLDIWSVGCCLYELYTGKVLFPGPSNNDMLRLHMELKGPFPKKMLRKGAFSDHHFDQDLNFHATEEDPVTKKTVKRILVNIKTKDFSSLISSYPGEDPKMLANFKDMLDRIFVLDPEKRLTVSQALSHPFITGK